MANDRGSGLMGGLIVGAGAVFLFGTKKGKEIRKKVKDQYPEVFEKIDEIVTDVKGNLSDKYYEVAEMSGGVKGRISDRLKKRTKKL